MGLQAKIIIPLIILFSIMAGSMIWTNYTTQKNFAEKVIEKQAIETVDQYFDSTNTLMITGAMDNREILRKKLLSNPDIVDARIIRGKLVTEGLGEGYPHEKPADDLDRQALEGKEIRLIQKLKTGRVLTVITPFRAKTNYRGTNCIECHEVPENSVLGAARVSYSLAKIDKDIENNTHFMFLVVGGLFALGLALLLIIVRILAISKIKKMKNHIDSISQDLDLTKKLPVASSQDELAEMGRSFDDMINNIHHSMVEVREAVAKISDGSKEISIMAHQSIGNSVSQQEMASQMTSSIIQLAENSQSIAQNTRHNTLSSEKVDQDVEEGANRAQKASGQITNLAGRIGALLNDVTMLEKETQQITSLVKIIDDVTMKTHLLSINASVEAARAGEHGRGFSVVASEVNQLAQETSASTTEINLGTEKLMKLVSNIANTIKEINKLANQGNEDVGLSSQSFSKVAYEIRKLDEMNRTISLATENQSATAKEMESNARQVSELSSQTATASKRIGEVGQQFFELTVRLESLIKKFKL